jgi:hypothetical protein
MDITRQDIIPLLKTVYPWLSKPNIVGVDIDKKIIAGKETEAWAIVVYVEKKKNLSELASDDFPIPREVELHTVLAEGGYGVVNVPTDVIEDSILSVVAPNDELNELNQSSESLKARIRPCPGGYGIQGDGIDMGTLGVNIFWPDPITGIAKYRLLTNNHVISQNGANKSGIVWQPDDSDKSLNYLTKVTGYVPLRFYNSNNEQNPIYCTQDLAWCDIDQMAGAPDITDMETLPKGIRKPIIGEKILMIGKTTGKVQKGTIQSMDYAGVMPLGGRYVYFKNLIKISGGESNSGDSGMAYIAEKDYKVVGIHMGKSPQWIFGCMIVYE